MTIDELTEITASEVKTGKPVLFKRADDPLLALREYLQNKRRTSSANVGEYIVSSLPTAPYD